MTLIEYVMTKYNLADKGGVVYYDCPSKYGFDDPQDCDDITCEECWDRRYQGSDSQPLVKVVLEPGAKLPVRAHPNDGGMDLFAMEGGTIPPCGSMSFETGVHLDIPPGYVGLLTSKSGLMMKGITSRGTIDCGYIGSIKAVLFNHSHQYVTIEKGQKITQLVILPIITPELDLVESLEATDRGEGGFGSSGAF